MSRITIYQFALYDITTDGKRRSRRWGTREGIASIGGEILDGTATEVDASAVASDVPWLTERDFDPNRRVGFQRIVTG